MILICSYFIPVAYLGRIIEKENGCLCDYVNIIVKGHVFENFDYAECWLFVGHI